MGAAETSRLYCFPIVAAGARRRLFFEGPASAEAHEKLCAAARALRARSEAGASMSELAADAFTQLTGAGFTHVEH